MGTYSTSYPWGAGAPRFEEAQGQDSNRPAPMPQVAGRPVAMPGTTMTLSPGEARRQRVWARRDAARQQRFERRQAMRDGMPKPGTWSHPHPGNTSAAQSVQQVAPEYRSMPNQPDLKPWSFEPKSMAGRPAAYGPSPTAAARYNEMARRMQAPGMAVQVMKEAQAANQAAGMNPNTGGAVQKAGDVRYMSGSHGYGYSVPGTAADRAGPHVFDNGPTVDSQASRAAGRIVYMPGTEKQRPEEISAVIRDRIPAAVKEQSAAAAVAKAGGAGGVPETPVAKSSAEMRPPSTNAGGPGGRMAAGARQVGQGISGRRRW